jgi:hypothetical protein
MKTFITTLKKTVTSIHEIIDPIGISRNKPRLVFAEKRATDPAGTPRTNVYRRDIDLSSGPAQ